MFYIAENETGKNIPPKCHMIGVTPARAEGTLMARLSQNSKTNEVRREEARESPACRSLGRTGGRSRGGARPLGPSRDPGESRPMEYRLSSQRK